MTSCCETSTPAEVEADQEAFDCDTCARRIAIQNLASVNLTAWEIFQAVSSRGTQTFGLSAYLIDALTDAWPADHRVDLIARLDLILSILAPAPGGDSDEPG